MTTSLPFDDFQYLRFRDLVFERIGVLYDSSKRDTLEQGIAEALGKNKSGDLEDFYERLASSPTGSHAWEKLVNVLTIGETYFFRTPEQFDVLKEIILPPLIERRKGLRLLRFWSAGCASGEEPYSLAILLSQMIPDIEQWHISILGTDINRERLEKARKARFRDWSFRQIKSNIRQTCFDKFGDEYHLHSRLRHMVHFSYLNLVEDEYPSISSSIMNIDIILWRNTAIYMPYETNRKIAARMLASLTPDGWLVVGPHETNNDLFDRFIPRILSHFTFYQKPGEGVSFKPAERLPRPAERKPVVPYPPKIVLTPLPAKPDPLLPQPGEKLETSQEEDALEYLRMGKEKMKQGFPDEALVLFQKALKLDPSHVGEGYCFIAKIYANQGRLEPALEACHKAVESSPLMVEAHCTLGTILEGLGQVEDAIDAYKKTLYLAPDWILAHVGLAMLYRKTGNPAEAKRCQANAVRLASHLPQDQVLPCSDDLTPAQLLSMLRSGVEA